MADLTEAELARYSETVEYYQSRYGHLRFMGPPEIDTQLKIIAAAREGLAARKLCKCKGLPHELMWDSRECPIHGDPSPQARSETVEPTQGRDDSDPDAAEDARLHPWAPDNAAPSPSPSVAYTTKGDIDWEGWRKEENRRNALEAALHSPSPSVGELVERCVQAAAGPYGHLKDLLSEAAAALQQQAGEIERLKAQVDRFADGQLWEQKRNREAQATIERLREALKTIVGMAHARGHFSEHGMASIARAALSDRSK